MRIDELDLVDIPSWRDFTPDREVSSISVPRYWYHTLRHREWKEGEPLKSYPVLQKEREILDNFKPRRDGENVIYIAPRPLTTENTVKIDLTKLDINNIRLTGQSEGYAIHYGDIPAEAIVGLL